MDDFTPYNNDFYQALHNLENVLARCIATRRCLSNEKCHMMMKKGVVLRHFISFAGIQVDPAKIKVIIELPTPRMPKKECSFLGYASYYHHFITHFKKI